MSPSTFVLAIALVSSPLLSWADGLTAPTGTLDAPGGLGWQMRLQLDTNPSRGALQLAAPGASSGLQTARLLGDFPLDAWRFGANTGLRVTSGLVLNQRFNPLGNAEADNRDAWPYLGLGLGGNGLRGNWGFQADVGLAAQSLGSAVRLGRVLGGGLSVGDAVRDLRLQPLVRLGMNYSF
jgi:hypothetical protein